MNNHPSITIHKITIFEEYRGVYLSIYYDDIIINNVFCYLDNNGLKVEFSNETLKEIDYHFEEAITIEFPNTTYAKIFYKAIELYIQKSEWLRIYLEKFGQLPAEGLNKKLDRQKSLELGSVVLSHMNLYENENRSSQPP
ncbi:MAG: hypothetical protein ACLFUW_00425 [Bacteroidales bacterium]